MAITINVAGGILIKTGTGTSGALEDFGYTDDGSEIVINELSQEVKSDRYGGEQGPAIDKQIFGMEAEIRLRMNEFDPIIWNKLESRLPLHATIGANPGRIATPGTLTFASAGGGLVRVLLYGAIDLAAVTGGTPINNLMGPKNFPFCSVHQATSYNAGSRFSKGNITFKAYQGTVSGNVVLWNKVVV